MSELANISGGTPREPFTKNKIPMDKRNWECKDEAKSKVKHG